MIVKYHIATMLKSCKYSAIRTDNARLLISRGALLNSADVMTSIAQNVPRAMEEFRKRLDEGITLDKDKAIISLDQNMIFQGNKMEETTPEMAFFLSLGESPFNECFEHPLCQSYLYSKFQKVVGFFVIFLMMPHFIFSGFILNTFI